MKICRFCRFYKPDYGIFCVNGWSRDGSGGDCMHNPILVPVRHDRTCQFWEKG